MDNKKLLIHNLYRQFEKDKWIIEQNLLTTMNEIMLITKKDDLSISMIIKIKQEEKNNLLFFILTIDNRFKKVYNVINSRKEIKKWKNQY